MSVLRVCIVLYILSTGRRDQYTGDTLEVEDAAGLVCILLLLSLVAGWVSPLTRAGGCIWLTWQQITLSGLNKTGLLTAFFLPINKGSRFSGRLEQCCLCLSLLPSTTSSLLRNNWALFHHCRLEGGGRSSESSAVLPLLLLVTSQHARDHLWFQPLQGHCEEEKVLSDSTPPTPWDGSLPWRSCLKFANTDWVDSYHQTSSPTTHLSLAQHPGNN